MTHGRRTIGSVMSAGLGFALAAGLLACGGGSVPAAATDTRHLEIDTADAVTPRGCTHTKHYYLIYNKYAKDPQFNVPWPFYNEQRVLCGQTLYNILWMPDNGDVRIQLAHEVIAALNNVNGGASNGGGSGFALSSGLSLLRDGDCGQFTADELATAQKDVTILDNYNEGVIGPGPCNDYFPGGAGAN